MRYKINGGKPISGEIELSSNKNLARKLIGVSVLTGKPNNRIRVQEITNDIIATLEMFEELGLKYKINGKEILIDSSDMKFKETPKNKLATRAPITILGSGFARLKKLSVPLPIGCKIGERKMDFHFKIIREFGGTARVDNDKIIAERRKLSPVEVELPYPSVGATGTFIFLGCLTKGKSILRNASKKREVNFLIETLKKLGAKIETKENTLEVCGNTNLRALDINVPLDEIEAMLWASIACSTNGEIKVNNIKKEEIEDLVLRKFEEVGGGFKEKQEGARFYKNGNKKEKVEIKTGPPPDFPTDIQHTISATGIQEEIKLVVHETSFEKRLEYLKQLNTDKIKLLKDCNDKNCRFYNKTEHLAIIEGPIKEIPNEMSITDLRAGFFFIVLALTQDREITINNAEIVEKDYPIAKKLKRLGVDIRVE